MANLLPPRGYARFDRCYRDSSGEWVSTVEFGLTDALHLELSERAAVLVFEPAGDGLRVCSLQVSSDSFPVLAQVPDAFAALGQLADVGLCFSIDEACHLLDCLGFIQLS